MTGSEDTIVGLDWLKSFGVTFAPSTRVLPGDFGKLATRANSVFGTMRVFQHRNVERFIVNGGEK